MAFISKTLILETFLYITSTLSHSFSKIQLHYLFCVAKPKSSFDDKCKLLILILLLR